MAKSTVEEIRQRFDQDVERFSNLETGQSATIDAPLALELIAEAAVATTPGVRRVLDVGCGAGNYTLKLLQQLDEVSQVGCTLLDLSGPMLVRARERVSAAGVKDVMTLQQDVREVELGEGEYDVILAAAVLHHLRTEEQWRSVFAKFYRALRKGGSVWIFDMVEGAAPATHQVLWRRYGEYLSSFKNEAYRDHVFAYIEKEDTPKPLYFQLRLLEESGFGRIEVLHKNGPFAAFGAVRM